MEFWPFADIGNVLIAVVAVEALIAPLAIVFVLAIPGAMTGWLAKRRGHSALLWGGIGMVLPVLGISLIPDGRSEEPSAGVAAPGRRQRRRLRAKAAATEFLPMRAAHVPIFREVWETSEAEELLARGWLQTTDEYAIEIASHLRSRGYKVERGWEALAGPRDFVFVDGVTEPEYDPRAGAAWSEACATMSIVGHSLTPGWQGFIGDTYVTACSSCGGRLLATVIEGEVVLDDGEVAGLCESRSHLLMKRRAV